MGAKWYECSTSNHQGLVADEVTGKNIAVVYDKEYAGLIAAAPDAVRKLVELADIITQCASFLEEVDPQGIEGRRFMSIKAAEARNLAHPFESII